MNESKTLHSVQFIDNYFPVIDGVTETVHQYARHMDAAVACPAMERRYTDKHDFPYKILVSKTIRIPFSRYACAIPGADRGLSKALDEEHADIFHVHSPSMMGQYAVRQAKKRGIPVVGTFHSKIYDAILEFARSRAIARMITNKAVRMYENCDEVWACSEETGETLRSYGFQKPYFVMPNGTDTSFPENADELKDRAASQYHLPVEKHILLFVGQQIWYKNQKLILDAFRSVCDRNGDFFLVMVGTGKDEQAIARYASSLNLTDNQVLFTGVVRDRELLKGIYLNADLLFFPSVFDNAPLVLREAAVLGVPTLATEGSNTAGAIRKNENGYTAAATPEAMSEEILRIFAEGNIREIGQNARETIPVAWDKLAQMVQEEYQAVINRYRKEMKR